MPSVMDGDTFTVMTDAKNSVSHQAKRCSRLALKVVAVFWRGGVTYEPTRTVSQCTLSDCSQLAAPWCRAVWTRVASRTAVHVGTPLARKSDPSTAWLSVEEAWQRNSFSALFCSRVSEVACQQSIHEQVIESSRGALHAGACVEERGGGGGGGSKAAQGGGAWLVYLGARRRCMAGMPWRAVGCLGDGTGE